MQKEIHFGIKIQYVLVLVSASVPFAYKLISSFFKKNDNSIFDLYIFPTLVVIFVLFILFMIWWGLRPKVNIDKNGVNMAGIGFVPWSDIKKLDILHHNKSIVIGVTTNDPVKTEKMKSRIFKAFEYTPNLPKRDFHISLEGINKKPEEVLNVIKLYKEIEGAG